MRKIISILLFVGALSACSSLPPALVLEGETVITDYNHWLASPSDEVLPVRLGGIIAKVTNLESRTRVEVVNMPIDGVGKPNLNAEPSGRFVAYLDGYVEPMSYVSGRLVTFLGESQGEEQGYVGDFPMSFRVMKVQGAHLWRIQETVVVHEIESHLSPCYGLHCRGIRGLSSRGTVIQEVK